MQNAMKRLTAAVAAMTVSIGLWAQYTTMSISTLRTIDSNGNYLYKDSMVHVAGIVHSINFGANEGKLTFTIQNTGGDGVWIYKSSTLNYTPALGDSLEIWGSVTVYRQLLEVEPDSIEVRSTGNALNTPTTVTGFAEMYEGELLQIGCVWKVASASWNTSGRFNTYFTDGTDTFTLRIENEVSALFSAAPTDTYHVVGVLGQYSYNDPWAGYQLYPRDTSDFVPCTSGGGGGGGGPTYTAMTIAQARQIATDSMGNSYYVYEDSLIEVTGVVHTQNFRGGYRGLQFTLEDSTGGIWAFNSNDSFGYHVQVGDEVTIWGMGKVYRQLFEIEVDSIVVNSTGNALNPADTVTWAWSQGMTMEAYEGQLVVLTNVWLVDTSQWGGNYYFTVDVTNGTDTMKLYIDNNTDLFGMSPIMGTFDVRGALGQYSSSDFYSGYQVWPRGMYDITLHPTTGLKGGEASPSLMMMPNPATQYVRVFGKYRTVEVLDLTGKTVRSMHHARGVTVLNVSDLRPGLYLVRGVRSDGTHHYGRLLKR